MTRHHEDNLEPAPFLVENIGLLPVGRALDVAMGNGCNHDYLLKHNELLEMFREFRCLRYHEGIVEGRKAVAGIVAQKV